MKPYSSAMSPCLLHCHCTNSQPQAHRSMGTREGNWAEGISASTRLVGLHDCGMALLQVGEYFCWCEETPPIPTTWYRDSWYSFPGAVSMSHLSVLRQQDLKELWPEAPTLCETSLALSACLRPDAVWIKNSTSFSSPKQEEVFPFRLSLLVKGSCWFTLPCRAFFVNALTVLPGHATWWEIHSVYIVPDKLQWDLQRHFTANSRSYLLEGRGHPLLFRGPWFGSDPPSPNKLPALPSPEQTVGILTKKKGWSRDRQSVIDH